MPTSVQNGTTSALSIGTETALGSAETSNKNLILAIDTANLANGDLIELRIYTKCLSGGTERLAYLRTYRNAQGAPLKYSPPVPADISFRCTIKQTTGTGRTFPWAILQP